MKTENPKQYCSFAACGHKEGVERYLCCYFCLDRCRKNMEGCQVTKECHHRQTKEEIELIILIRKVK